MMIVGFIFDVGIMGTQLGCMIMYPRTFEHFISPDVSVQSLSTYLGYTSMPPGKRMDQGELHFAVRTI
jgi:hypothetical protein